MTSTEPKKEWEKFDDLFVDKYSPVELEAGEVQIWKDAVSCKKVKEYIASRDEALADELWEELEPKGKLIEGVYYVPFKKIGEAIESLIRSSREGN